MRIIFATNNRHKINEIDKVITDDIQLVSLEDSGITDEIPENENTLEGNALEKARYVYRRTGSSVFADDTGLEVEALDNEPGVHSARYAGEEKDPERNMDKLLEKLAAQQNRKARFRTIIALIYDGQEYLFEGEVQGEIITERKGTGGFGYDPVFRPAGHDRSFAEMDIEEKNLISHRARAVEKLTSFLNTINKQ